MDFEQPWFDQQGTGVYPVYHVIRGMAEGAGKPMLETELSDGAAIQAVAYRDGGDTVLWIANLTGQPQEVTIDGLPGARGSIATLDLESFIAATSGPDGLETEEGPIDLLDLGAYALLRVRVG
ncbi:MAG: hypothetical protein HC861_05315 [Rhodospirillaceae bacterium]|nr:hypothetical protein [Rhodospirillaceae bacterium]